MFLRVQISRDSNVQVCKLWQKSLGIIDGGSLSKTKLAYTIRENVLSTAMVAIPPRNANTIELPELARILRNRLDDAINLEGIDEVVIENQISPVANRMKCLQSIVDAVFYNA